MALAIKFAPVLSPGNAGSNDEVKIGFALYRDGVIVGIEDYNGTNGSSQLVIRLADEATGSIIATYGHADLSEAAATSAADHYWAAQSVAGLAGAQVLVFIFDINWNNGVDPAETLAESIFYPVNTSA